MVFHAALAAAQPNLSQEATSLAIPPAEMLWYAGQSVCSKPSFPPDIVGPHAAAVGGAFRRRDGRGDFGEYGCLPCVSRPLLRVHASGPYRRPAARRRSASLTASLRGLGSSQKKFECRGNERRTNFFRVPPRKHSLALGSRAHSLASRRVTRAGYGKYNETEITTMYTNKVTLIGFLGSDAEVRTNDDRSLTVLSLATKSSYKKDGKYIEHTDWHRCIVFGKLGEFAAKLTKGAHILIEGEYRSRKYTSTKTDSEQTVWEVRVSSILKLDRAAKAAVEDDEELTEEEVAA